MVDIGSGVQREIYDVILTRYACYLITVGYMNRSNPKGIVTYSGTMDGDKIAGTMDMKGVVMELPDGSEMPIVRFELRRKS